MVFNYTKDKNNIVTLTMDMAEKSANLIDEDYFKSLLENIVKLENESDLKGVILTSAKKTFLAGADLEMLYSLFHNLCIIFLFHLIMVLVFLFYNQDPFYNKKYI